ncbi:MAG TPA: T9SS type A sorting domain-containing protein [Bacteroidia bacterium]|jgi:hypothetical protein|nr:T9SS type A sorting domain-containing protein [Bacteroidia bacterium]
MNKFQRVSFSFRKMPGAFMAFASVFMSIIPFNNTNAQCNTNIGIYYWGGNLHGIDSSSIIPTAKKLADSLNVNTIRITLACNDDAVYRNTGKCINGSSLTKLAQRADFNSIITDPQFTTVIITAYDWTSFGDCSTTNFIDTSFYTVAHTNAIEQEYTDLANYLKTFSKKTFIVGTWESDNQIYCGAAYSDPTCPAAPQNIAGYTKWIKAKIAGLNAAGAPNVKTAIEFCNIHSLEAAGKPDVIDTIVPHISPDYFLYSSYESINISPQQTDNDITFIRKKLAKFGKDSTALLIGEMGFGANNYSGGDTAAANRLQGIITVLKKRNIPIGITWVLLDANNFCAYDTMQNITAIGKVVKANACKNPTGLYNLSGNISQISISPNPANGQLKLSFTAANTDNYTIEICNELGQLFYSETLKNFTGNYEKVLSLQSFNSGVYFIKINSDKETITKKLVLY